MKYMGSIDKCSILDADILPMEAALLILDFLIGIEIVGVMTKLIPRISIVREYSSPINVGPDLPL